MEFRSNLTNSKARNFVSSRVCAPDAVYLRVRRRRFASSHQLLNDNHHKEQQTNHQQKYQFIPRSLRLECLSYGPKSYQKSSKNKRHFDEELLSSLNVADDKVEKEQEEAHGDSANVSRQIPRQYPRKKRTAIWKLVDNSEVFSNEIKKSSLKRVVTAVVLNDSDDEKEQTQDGSDTHSNSKRSLKRRKLAIVYDTTTDASLIDLMQDDHVSINNKTNKKEKKQVFKVLHPLERMVDESIKDVFIGNKTVQQHIQFVLSDVNLLQHSTGNDDEYKVNPWLLWCNSECGNIIHACAIWNDVEALQLLVTKYFCSIDNTTNNFILQHLCLALDGNGSTPYDVALLTGHSSICCTLESYGMITSHNATVKKSAGTNDENDQYEYDLYCLNQQHSSDTSQTQTLDDCSVDNDDMFHVTCALQNGQTGYFNEEGELVLELFHGRQDLIKNQMNTDGDENDNSDNDDDDDSNRESHVGNDYPDEEEYDSEDIDKARLWWNNQNDDDDDNDQNNRSLVETSSDDDRIDQSFRNRHFRYDQRHTDSYGEDDDDENSESGLYDVSYG